MVVAAEDIRFGQVSTIERMLNDPPDKQEVKDNLATFTLGCGAVAMVLTHRSISQSSYGSTTRRHGPRLLGGAAYGNSQHNDLCVAQRDWMRTNSTALLLEGMRVIATTWDIFKRELGWDNRSVDRLFTHQVSEKQRQIGLKTLGVGKGRTSDRDIDYPTLQYLGNVASVSAPISMAIANEEHFIEDGNRVCLLGVGSGINSVILGIQW
jgi:3-oxoacyl-[acyl-carrier-protein] synthase-3